METKQKCKLMEQTTNSVSESWVLALSLQLPVRFLDVRLEESSDEVGIRNGNQMGISGLKFKCLSWSFWMALKATRTKIVYRWVLPQILWSSGCYCDAGMCLLTDQGGDWLCGNKWIKGRELKEVRQLRVSQGQVRVPTESIICADLLWVSWHCQLCHMLGMEVLGEWSQRAEEKESFTPTGMDSPTCSLSDLQSTLGICPGQRTSVV